MLQKVASHVLEGLYVNAKGVQTVKKLCQNRKTRVVLVPMYKSFADPLLMYYIQYLNDIELGFTFGNYEDSPKIQAISTILKNMGHLLIQRKQSKDNIFQFINQTMMEEVIEGNPVTTVFQNDYRPLTGKFGVP